MIELNLPYFKSLWIQVYALGVGASSSWKSSHMDLIATRVVRGMVQRAFGTDLTLECSGSDCFLAASPSQLCLA